MFVMMIIMFGVILNEVGLAKRLLFFILKFAGTKVKQLSFFLAVSSTLLSTLFHDATITIIMLFAILPLFHTMGITPKKSNNLSKFFIILIPLAASAGGFGTMLGGGRCALAVDITQRYNPRSHRCGRQDRLPQVRHDRIPGLHLHRGGHLGRLLPVLPSQGEGTAGVRENRIHASHEQRREGRGRSVHRRLHPVVLWRSDRLARQRGLGPGPGQASALPAGSPSRPSATSSPGNPGSSSARASPWVRPCSQAASGQYLAESFLPLLQGRSPFVTYYGMGLFGSALSSMMSNSAAVALSLPITLPMAKMMNMSVEAVGLLAPMTTSFIMLVIGCPPTIIAYSTGYFSQVEFSKVAIPWCLVLLAISVCAALLYWPMIGFG